MRNVSESYYSLLINNKYDVKSYNGFSCASFQVYNLFPWLGPFLKNWRHLMKNLEENIKETKSIIADLKETLNPEMCRCFVDAFLTRKLNLEVSCPLNHLQGSSYIQINH